MNQLSIERILDRELAKSERAAEKRMRATSKVILAQLSEMYAKYEKDGVLTIVEMNRYNRLQREFEQLTATLTEDYQQAVTQVQEMQENHYLLKFLLAAYLFDQFVSRPSIPTTEIIAASFLFILTSLKLPRLSSSDESNVVDRFERELRKSVERRESKVEIRKRLKSSLPEQLAGVKELVEQLTDSFINQIEPTVNGAKLKMPNRTEVKKSVKYDGLSLSHFLTVKRNRVVNGFRQEIGVALRKNETVRQMSKRISDKMEKEIGYMQRFMRNVSDRVRAQALGDVESQIAAISDVRGVWLSKRDSVVRPAHRKLDGQRTDRKGYFHYKLMKAKAPRMWGVPSMDDYCRCKKLTLLDFKVPIVEKGVNYDNAEYQRQLKALAEKKVKELELAYDKAFAEALKEIPESQSDMPFVAFEEWLRIMGVRGDLSQLVMEGYMTDRFLKGGD